MCCCDCSFVSARSLRHLNDIPVTSLQDFKRLEKLIVPLHWKVGMLCLCLQRGSCEWRCAVYGLKMRPTFNLMHVSFPSQHLLTAGMQMPGAGMAGLPMPPAMMMPGPRQGPLGPMGGPPRMPGLSGQPGMPRPPHAPPPRPMQQVSPVLIPKKGSKVPPLQVDWCIEGFFMSLGPEDPFLSGIQSH